MSYPNVSDHESRIAALESRIEALEGQSSSDNSLLQFLAKLKKWFPFIR